MTMEDFEPYAAMWVDWRVTQFIGGAPRPRDVAWGKFTQGAGLWLLLGYGFWSVIDRADDRFLGVGGFAQFERGIAELFGHPEQGWAFIPDSWGRGIASEAVAAMLHWADQVLSCEIRCMIDDANQASVKVATHNGYVPCATLTDRQVFRRPAPVRPD